MTRIDYSSKDDEFIKKLKFVPAQKVNKCPIPELSDVYEIHGRALARRRNPLAKFGGNPLQEYIDRNVELGVIENANGEPCLGESCMYYGGDRKTETKKEIWCKWNVLKSMSEEGKKDLDKLIES